MSDNETLRIHINPKNRLVSTSDPAYIEAWTNALEERRELIKAQLRVKIEKGELNIPVKEYSPDVPVKTHEAMQSTPEEALHFQAHSLAEREMQNWALKRGIGMIGMTSGWDHGQAVEYVDDPAVPFLDFEIEKAA